MRNILLNTIFMIFLAITLVLFTIYKIIDYDETKVNDSYRLVEINGEMQSFEVFHNKVSINHATKKYTERYNEKLFAYLEHIQEQRDKTFMKSRVFLKEK